MKRILFSIGVLLGSINTQGVPLHVSKWQIEEEIAQHNFRDIPVSAFTYKQKLDHFNPFDFRTYTENYWVSPGYSKDANSPVLFYICGETACSPSDVQYMFRGRRRSMLRWS